MKLTTLPVEDGFRLPAAFEENQAGYMIWPQRPDNWRDGGKPAQYAFAKLLRYLPNTNRLRCSLMRTSIKMHGQCYRIKLE